MGALVLINGVGMAYQRGLSGVKVLLIVLLTMLFSVGITIFVIRTYIFPAELTPVTLNDKEELKLDNKLRQLGWLPDTNVSSKTSAQSELKNESRTASIPASKSKVGELTPEAYREFDGDRQVIFSEKEVNSMIGNNPDFARRVAIDFSDNLASAKILVPIPEDFPFMAGEILRVNAGIDIHLDQSRRPVVALVGVSLMGVPIPNAWLGNMKRVNLVGEFGDSGFWNTFADGVEELQVRDGELFIKLRK
ncbi:arginine N-succinyltransferase [Shewanella sp. D64]|uniref:arginine N-succinyltransferase n=1 Tax=unclassified Shewanella TaxID=196818 RepID=UPI0022BA2DBB|nr:MULTISPECIES: arginine N-succinyltransferase [unclassified Shewanella]MEC4725101.1 arginine N-succinyltransferase [Shewanella sp. D64]MEC4737002.1 arginine N-succinyltransferase [Shewanella sp. E94]WBJ96590.1 arginine N-succinyltransferase [Shewanella sp. MTB7]